MRRTVLVVADYYLPGYRGGGPVRTISNMVEWMGDDFDFYLLTRDRDLGSESPYHNIRYQTWNQVGKARVRYLQPEEQSAEALRGLVSGLNYDVLYLNSLFSRLSVRLMWMRWLRRLPRRRLVLAPRGELHPGALAIRPGRKRVYLALARLLGVYGGVHWQAASEQEAEYIRRWFPGTRQVTVAMNLLNPELPPSPARIDERDAGAVRAVFLSRVARNKNLDFALRVLADVTSTVHFDIYGPVEDDTYWTECQRLIAALPDHVTASYHGPVAGDAVIDTLSGYELFFLPTQGESFGHVIWEALYAGCLVLISDRTPWRDLEDHGVGWVLPLDAPDKFVSALEDVAIMNPQARRSRAQKAQTYATWAARRGTAIDANRRLFLADED